jgi:hypothetical protein
MSADDIYAITIPDAQIKLGRKSRSGIYQAIGRGLLDAVKDGDRILVTVESIRRFQRSWPRANIKAPSARR